jgi:hypothetical protein
MYLSELLAALARRWWLVVLGVLATAGLCFGAYTLVPTEHEIHATMLVLPPETTVEVVHNPLLALGDLPPAADVLARAMTSGEIADELVPLGSTGEYTVARDTSTSGPVLTITATDRTAAQAVALLDAVISRVPDVFASLQATIDVTDPATMHVTQLARETQPTESNKSQIRAMLIAAVGGLAFTVFAASLLDGLIRRRKATRRSRRRDVSVVEEPRPTAPVEESPKPAVSAMADAQREPDDDRDDNDGATAGAERILAMTPRGPRDGDYREEARPT